eukprot:scaffold1381_cov179-Ochromonas_danica.AAC.1
MNNDIKLLKNEPLTNKPLLLTEGQKEDNLRPFRPPKVGLVPLDKASPPITRTPPSAIGNGPAGY